MGRKVVVAAGAVLSVLALPAWSHHSNAMFDATKTVEMVGTVKEFQWTNPHSWLVVMVTDEQGKTTQWLLELGSPAGMARTGWRPKTLVPGDTVTVKHHPLKDGNPGGQLLTVLLPNGTTMEH